VYPQATNTWRSTSGSGDWPGWEYNPAFNVTDADFVSLDSAQITAPRKPDGSLPDITLFRLAEGSDLIGEGTYVGMSAIPDVGVDFEYLDAGSPPVFSTATDITAFTLAAQTGAATINTGTHTISIEVEYGTNVTSLTPTITLNYGATIDPTSGTARDFTTPQIYTVTAEDEITEQEWTVTVTVGEEEEEPSDNSVVFLKIGNTFAKSSTGVFLKRSESLGPELITEWTNNNNSWDTFTSVGKNITIATNTNLDNATCTTDTIASPPNVLKIVIDLTVYSGTVPALRVSFSREGSSWYEDLPVLTSGINTINYVVPENATHLSFRFQNLTVSPSITPVSCNFSAVFSIKEIIGL
jgi:hypothetical protein